MNDQCKTKKALIQELNALQYAGGIINTVREPLIVLDQDLRVVTASRSFYDVFKVNPEETVGQFIYDLGNKQWDIPKLRELLKTILPQKTTFDNYEVEHDFATIGKRVMLLNARQIKRALGKERIILLAIEDITHSMRIERSLAENEARLRTLVQTIPDLIWLKSADGIYLDCNTMFERFFGAKKADIVGKTDYDFVDKELADFFREHDRKAMAAGKPSANEEWLTFADDGYRGLFDTIKTPMYDAEGKLIGVLGIARDVSERKREEEEHKAHIRFLESLERIDQAIKEETDVEQMLRHVLQEVFVIFDCDRAWLFYPCDPDAPTFRVPMEICRPEYPGAKVLNMDMPMSPDMAQNLRDALAYDDPVIYIAGTEKPINKVTAEQFGVQSQMFVALYPKIGKPWVLGMHQCSYPRIWTEEEKILFKEISRRISDGLSGVLYLHELQDNEVRLSEAQQLAKIGSWEWNLLTNHVWWSDETYRIFGVTPQDFVPSFEANGKFIHPDDFARYSKSFEHSLQTGEPLDVDIRLVTNDGLLKHCQAKGKLIYDDAAQPTCFLGTIMDITERKQAEEMLKESVNKYRLLADNIQDVIFVLDMNLKYTYISPSIKIMRGYEPEEILKQQSIEQALTPSSRNLALKAFSEIIELEKSEHGEIPLSRTLQLEMRRKDGTTLWTDVRFSFIRDENKRPMAIMGVSRDITERKKAEDELRKSEARYRGLFEHMSEGFAYCRMIFENDEPQDFIYLDVNNAFEKLTGLRNVTGKKVSEVIPGLRETDPQIFTIYARVSLTGKSEKFEIFVKALKMWFSVSVYGPEKEHFIAVFDVITERKQAEEKLHRTLESLKRAVGTTIAVLGTASEARDPYTAGHQKRVADLARTIATEMGLSQDKIEGIRMAGSIHDIGKLSIPAEILSKPTKLTDLEFSLIKEHSRIGYEMLKDVESPWPLAQIVHQHHERMNGSGYPGNLKGDDILIEARIMAVADVVESMASHRPYREALGIEAALEEIEKNKGILYDNVVADACLKVFREKGYQLT